MARKTTTTNRGYSIQGPTRLINPIAMPRMLTPSTTLKIIGVDNRDYHPSPKPLRPPAAIRRVHARLLPKNLDRFGKAIRADPFSIRFGVPRNVAICIRRRIRKEVLHALGKTGGGSSHKRKRRTQWSAVGC